MKKRTLLLGILIVNSLLSLNCATIMKGYEYSVTLHNAPEGIKVMTHDGTEVPVFNTTVRMKDPHNAHTYFDKEVKQVALRTNREYTLHLKYTDKEKVVTLYPKIGFGWGLLDFLCGVYPSFIDAYTGAWNRFPDIDAAF